MRIKPRIWVLAFSLILGSRVSRKDSHSKGYEVETNNGTVRAKKVVVATGPWSKNFFGSIGIKIPIKPVRHPVAIFQRPEEYSGNHPLIFDFPREAYYKPEGNHFFYTGSLAGELDSVEIDPDNYNETVSFDEIAKFSENAATAVPIMGTGGRYQRGYTGVYDVTPDQHPIIDEFSDAGYPDLYCLIGLSGHGFKLSPAFGRIMSDFLTGEKTTNYDRSIFRRSRFEEGKLLRSRYEFVHRWIAIRITTFKKIMPNASLNDRYSSLIGIKSKSLFCSDKVPSSSIAI